MCVLKLWCNTVFVGGAPGEEGGELTAYLLTTASHAWDVPECQNAARKASNFPKEVVVCPGPSDSQCLKQIFPQQSTSTPGSRVAAGSWECALRWQHLLTTTVWLLVAPPKRSGRQQTWNSMISIWKSHHLELNNLNQFKLERLPTVKWKEGLYLYSYLGVTLRWLVNLVSSPGISQSGAGPGASSLGAGANQPALGEDAAQPMAMMWAGHDLCIPKNHAHTCEIVLVLVKDVVPSSCYTCCAVVIARCHVCTWKERNVSYSKRTMVLCWALCS